MKKSRPEKPAAPDAVQSEGLLGAWVRFWFTAVDPVGLHALRVLAGLLFLAWLLPFAGHVHELFGLDGWFDAQAYAEAARLPDGPPRPIGWSVLFLCGGRPEALTILYWSSLAVLVLFTLGVWTRLTSVLTWVIVASFTATPIIAYQADSLLRLFAFYLMVGYVLLHQRNGGQSLVARLLGPRLAGLGRGAAGEPSLGANLAVRLLQVHFAILVLVAGLHKLQSGDWWAGVAFWYDAFPPFTYELRDITPLAPVGSLLLFVLSALAYATLGWQLTFPLFAWRPRGRPLLLGGALAGWVGAAFLCSLPLVGPALVVGCLSYLTPTEWRWALEKLVRAAALIRLRGDRPAPASERPEPLAKEEPSPLASVEEK